MKLDKLPAVTLFAIGSVICQQPSQERLNALAATDLADFAENLPENDEAGAKLLRSWNDIKRGAKEALDDGESSIDALAAEYTKLFRGLIVGRWARPAYETVYRARRDDEMTRWLSSIGDLYRRSGIALETAERTDFIAVEFDVMREMLSRNAQGISGAYQLAEELYRDHISIWVPAQAKEVKDAAYSDYYRAVADYIGALATGFCVSHDTTESRALQAED